MIEISRNNLPKWQLVLFGLSEVFDGLVTVVSFGYLCSNLSMKTISYFTLKHFKEKKNVRS